MRTFEKKYVAFTLFLLVLTPLFFLLRGGSGIHAASPIHHYLYVFPDRSIYVYDIDNNFQLVNQISFPMTDGGRGIIADPAGGYLYLSYHGDGGPHGNGSLLKYDLINNITVWTQNYPFGIDSGAISTDGKTIYMPDGEAAYDGIWRVINASDGTVRGKIFTVSGGAAHNTVVGFGGKNVYLGALNKSNLFTASTATNTVTQTSGNYVNGVRPFTINGAETLAFTTHTNYLGFQVADLKTGNVLYTVPVKGFSAPSNVESAHGISISPDEKELYLIDTVNSYVHVFNISGLPASAPSQAADIPLSPAMGGTESPCLYDCAKEGWIGVVGDGRYVVVGDSGDIIDTTTHKVAYYLPVVNNTRKFLEIDWQNNHPIFTTSRQGVGYVNVPAGTPLPTPLNAPGSSTPTPSPTATTPVSSPTATPSPTPSPTVTVSPTPSPTPGTVLAQDNFTRANQQYWGTSSGGQTWGGDANTQSVFSIHNNVGQIANGTGPYNAVLGPTVSNAQVLFTGSLSSFSNNNLGAVLRWQNANNLYKAYINGTQLVIQRRLNGVNTNLAQVNFAASANTAYNLRFQIVGNVLSAKVWAASSAEPTTWSVSTTDGSLTSGQCGLRIQVIGNTSANVTYFEADSAS